MTTAERYNEAVEGLAVARERIRELEARIGELKASAIYKRMLEREAQITANEGQLDRWSFEIEPLKARNAMLKARNATLEAVREAASRLNDCLLAGPMMPAGDYVELRSELGDALAAVENDVEPIPQD